MTPPTAGVRERLRGLLASTLGLVEVRLALLGTELAQSTARTLQGLWLGLAGVALLGCAVLFGGAALVMALAPEQRPLALLLLALAVGVAGVGLLALARGALRPGPEGPLPLTRAELREDLAALSRRAGDRPGPAAGAADAPGTEGPR